MRYEIAVVASVTANGVTLIFPGEVTATTKEYLCNTSATFYPGDRVKVAWVDGTYIVEYPIGSPTI